VLLVGSNGAGKSSPINAVIGLVPIESGRITFDGKDLSKVSCASRARLGILLPEGRRVFDRLTVTENVLSGAARLPASQAQANLQWIRQAFPLLSERGSQPAGQLSGGEQQIAALARAVSTFRNCYRSTNRSSAWRRCGSTASARRSVNCSSAAPPS
jgi:branched-chain amino acid transport system ATP-binding protein